MSFEKMRVYQAAELLDAEVQRLVANIRLPVGDDLDQLHRAIGSILTNIPEAYGSDTIGRKRYHLSVARGSADETRAVLRRLIANNVIEKQRAMKALALTSAVAKLLTAWMQALER